MAYPGERTAAPGSGRLSAGVLAAAALVLAGCATAGPPPGSQAAAAAVAQGRDIAQYRCAACHGVAGYAASRSPTAPPFRDLRRRYDAASLERRLLDIAGSGHGAMPGFVFAPSEVEVLTAYIQTVR